MSRANGWAGLAKPDSVGLSAGARAALVHYFTEAGRMEHASVAAFARFALELLELGAPADLVARAHAAMGDEIEHARSCFALAQAFGGKSIGPGPLAMDGVLDRSFEEIVHTAILEACIGETLAAAEAEEALASTRDPEVRRVLERIARDEAEHADLGFRFLAWALEQATPPVRTRLVSAFASAVRAARVANTATASAPADLSAFGVLSPVGRTAVRELILREILAPLALRLSETEQAFSTAKAHPSATAPFVPASAQRA